MDAKIKLVILSPNSKANQTKKINKGFSLSNACESIDILAFDREEGCADQISYTSLGKIPRTRYIARIFAFLGALRIVPRHFSKADAVFTWTMDCLILALISKILSGNGRLKIIYNVRDIHPQLTKKTFLSALLRKLDKFLSRFVDLFVFTSPLYATGYYSGILGLDNIKYALIENKVPEELWGKIERPRGALSDDRTVTIGYFGLMSYANSWEIIKNAANANPKRIKFYMRGHNYLGKHFEDEASQMENVCYGGAYKNPDDLREMFDKIDVSWAVNSTHFTPKTNDEWAMCNRFYEGLYFKKPLIVQEGSAHSKFVRENDIGICVDARDIKGTVEQISSITKADVSRWSKNIENIDESIFILQRGEYANIISKLER